MAMIGTCTVILLSASLLTYAQIQNQPNAQPQTTPSSAPSGPADSTQLEIIKAPRPQYPLEAEAQELQGEVWIKLLIAETGDVEDAEIISGNPILAKAALDAMKKWKFKPFIRNGKAVKVSTKMPFDFAYANRVSDVHPRNAPGPEKSYDNGSSPASAGKEVAPGPSQAESPSKNAGASPDSTSQVKRLRVSQGVMEGLLIHRVSPVYPPEAKRMHIQGDVILEAKIGKDGRVTDIKAISGPKELIDASVGAIEQWRYRPYLLKDEPVEVFTTIRVQFRM